MKRKNNRRNDSAFLTILQESVSNQIFKIEITGQDRLTILAKTALTSAEIESLKNTLINGGFYRKFSHYLQHNTMVEGTMQIIAGSVWYNWREAARK